MLGAMISVIYILCQWLGGIEDHLLFSGYPKKTSRYVGIYVKVRKKRICAKYCSCICYIKKYCSYIKSFIQQIASILLSHSPYPKSFGQKANEFVAN